MDIGGDDDDDDEDMSTPLRKGEGIAGGRLKDTSYRKWQPLKRN